MREIVYNSHCLVDRAEVVKQRLKVYYESSFWSCLNGYGTPLSHVTIKQA